MDVLNTEQVKGNLEIEGSLLFLVEYENCSDFGVVDKGKHGLVGEDLVDELFGFEMEIEK